MCLSIRISTSFQNIYKITIYNLTFMFRDNKIDSKTKKKCVLLIKFFDKQLHTWILILCHWVTALFGIWSNRFGPLVFPLGQQLDFFFVYDLAVVDFVHESFSIFSHSLLYLSLYRAANCKCLTFTRTWCDRDQRSCLVGLHKWWTSGAMLIDLLIFVTIF